MTAHRIGFDVTSAVKKNGRGIAQYVRSLLEAVARTAPEVEPILYIRNRRWFARRRIHDLWPQASRRPLLASFGPRDRRLHAFHGLGVRLPRTSSAPRSFTLHDLRVFDVPQLDHPSWVRTRTRRTREAVARAQGILCLTEHGRARLLHHFPEFPAQRVAVVPHGVDHERFRPLPMEQAAPVLLRYGVDRPFLLQVGQLGPHKNPETSLRAFAASQASAGGVLLVLAGGAAPDYRAWIEQLASSLRIAPQLRWISQVPAADLPAFYSAAEAVLFPSRYEGFGMPVLEAMACGAPGLVSDAACLPEVAGGAWPAAATEDDAAMAKIIDRYLIDPHLRNDVCQRSLRRAAGFTWEISARRTIDFLLETVSTAKAAG